jgi:tetratricopeptide (TPR) repeat protein
VNRQADDLYELATSFVNLQNDIPQGTKYFKRALELDPNFTAARMWHVLSTVIEIFNGYSNDGDVLYRAEEELHQAEQDLPKSDGLLLSGQAAVYLAQGRLDRIPSEKLEERWRSSGRLPDDSTTWLVILRMLQEQNREAEEILRIRVERHPLDAPPRMFLGEILRTEGDTEGAIRALQRVLQQAPGNITAAWFLTMAFLDQGKTQQARQLLEGMGPEFHKNYMWRHALGIVLAAEGKREDALQIMDEDTLKFHSTSVAEALGRGNDSLRLTGDIL